jgi:hypothetical protein
MTILERVEQVSGTLTPATWSGAMISGLGALTVNEFLAIGGFLLVAISTAVNTWHKIVMVRLARRDAENADKD